MSTQRRIRRSNEKLKTKQVETAVEKRPKLAQRIISAVTAMGIFANPLVASAQIISGAEFTNVTTNGSVIDIETKKIIDRTGVNVFQQFGLNANQIANMYFGSKDSNNQADNLVNFVNSHIDINGTVNAVKNNKIGGNLYFLSKDGMAVGSSGVINTGALHVMTPTAAQMTAMQNVLSAGTNDAQKAQLELLRNSPAQIPLNPSGTITVLGKINATNKIDLRAANILVGIDGNKNINKAAALNTGVVDFTDLVNIQGSSGAVQSGLTGALTATMDTGSGDIILKASADAGTKSIADGAPGFIKDKLDGLADEVTYREITASVQNYGTIAAAGGVDISATAQNVKRTETGAEEAGSLAQVTATVDLAAGSVSGVKDVTVQAVAKNEYVDEDGLVHKAAVLGLGAATPITGDVAFAVLETEAAVNIGQEAAVSSSGGDVAITAESTTLAATQASATGYKFASKGGQKGTYVPAGAVTYTEASNKAVVNVDGKVNAQGDVEVKAKADLKIDATDNLAVKGENANQIVVGVLVTNGDNTAQVNINKNQTAGYEKALTAGGDIVIGAESVNDLNSELNVAGADASALVTAVNVTTYNSRAGVNVDRSLEAGNDLSVSADNTFTKNTVISSNKIGSGKYMAKAMETLNKVGATDALKAVGGKVKDALFKSDGEGGADGMTYEGIKLADFLKAGATVAVVNENNTAAVNIGSEAGLTAQEGQLTLDARMQMDDIHMVASGASNSYTKEHGGGLVGNATVMVTNLEDTATVTVADRSETNAQPAALTGKKGVAVNSRVLVDYNRVQKMVDDVKRAAADIKAGFSGLGGSISSDWEALLKAVTDKADALEAALGTFTADEMLLTSDDGILKATNPFSAATELLSALDTLNEQIVAAEKDPAQQTTAAKLKQAVSGLSDIVVNSIAFADPNSYANFAAVSNAKGDDGGGSGTGTAATIAGTVMITNVDHGSKVLLGNNVQINSEGTVDVGAENLMKDVSLAGVTAAIFNNAGGNSSVGATVNIADFDTNTVVAVGEGSHITGGEINIAGTNTIDHVAVAASAGKGASGEAGASGVTLNGMVSVISGDSKVLTIVDDEASLTAQKNGSGAAETSGKVTVKGLNDTSLVNVAGGLSMTHSNGAVGIGVAVNDFAVHNIAGIGDVKGFSDEVFGADNDEMSGDEGYTTAYTATGAVKKAASVQAYGLDVAAVTDGTINTVSAAGSVSSNDSSGKEGFFDKLGNKMNSLTDKVLGENGLVGKAGSIFADKVNGDGSSSSAVDDAFNVNGTGQGGGQLNINRDNQGGSQGFMPEFSISGSGSVSVNSLSNETKAVVDNAVISLNDGDMSVTARDNAFVGAYSGAAALVWKSSGENGAKGKSAALAGAAAVNDIDNTISAIVANSTINDAGNLDVLGLSGGTTIAAGLGLEISKNEGGSGTGGAAVSVNLIDHTVNALMEDNTVTKAQSIDVTGYQSDVQVTGGLQVAAGNQGTAVGASVAVASLNNTINAGIKGTGKNGLAYTDVGNVEVHALSALTAVTAAVSAGATKTSKSDGTSVNIQGAGVYNSVNNTANAYIDGANIATTAAGSVRVRAMDTNKQDAAVYQELLTRGASDKAAELARTSSIIDTKGNSYYDGLDTAMTDDGSGDGTLDLDTIGKNGSTIVTAAAGVAVTNGDAAVGASVAISDIDNKFTAKITDSEITAADVEAQANSDTLLVGVDGGVGVGNKIGGVGSASWQDIDNTAAATISGSTIKAQSVSGRAVNTAKMINVAGQIAGGKSALGAGLGYSGLSNVTGAYLHDNLIDKRIIDTDGVIVNANAANGNKMYTIGASVAAATENAAITGTVVLTRADGKTDALINDSEITNAKAVGAAAADTTYTYTVMGNVAAGAKAGVGAGVAYTDIGGSSGDAAKAGQVTNAGIKGTQIESAAAGAAVSVSAVDSSKILNVAVGVGGAGKVAVQGAASTALVNKQTQAVLEATDIDKDDDNAARADVTVKAQSDSKIFNTAVVAAGAGTAAVGAGVAVNRIVQQTGAEVQGGTMNLQELDIRAVAAPKIETIGVGGAVGGNVGVSGSVAVNMIANDVTAHIGSGAVIAANGSVGVVAQSDEQISNYAGTLSGGGTAAVGVSTSVNQISGTTGAFIGDEGESTVKTSVTAKGNGSGIKTDSTVKDDQIHDTLIDKDTIAMGSQIERTAAVQKGIVVDASSTRDLKSFLVNASGGMYAGVAATVNVNLIEGATDAKISNAILNGGIAGSGSRADVSVRAGDYTNSAGFVGSLGIGVEGAGIGAGSDTNTVSRDVTAQVADSDIKAQALKVAAEGKQGISSFTVGMGAAGVGAGVAGVVTVSKMDNTTKAVLTGATADVTTLDVEANHLARTNAGNISTGGAGVGAGIGLSVGVLQDDSVTEAEVSGSTVNSSGNQSITATNKTVANPAIAATGVAGAGAGVAGAVSVNNINSKVKTNITNAALTAANGSIAVAAKNTVAIDAYTGGIAAGAVGVGASVTVNTIDSTVQSNVTNSNLTAQKDITVTAEELRDISQLATNAAAGGAAVGGNILITNVGKALNDADENEQAAREQIEAANAAYGDTDMLSFARDLGALEKGSIEADANTVSVGAGFGGGRDSQISVNIKDGSMTAQGNLAATAALGENIKSETADNYADISGVVKSGIHNKLQVDIGGATKTTAPTYDENGNLLTSGGVSYEGITITIGEGSDWFDAEELTPAAIVIINGLFDRYKEVSGLMQDYLQGSDEYNAYKNELSSIVLEMRNAGMVALDQYGNQTDIPVDQINVAAIKLPDIVVSGGNINIEADKLQGTGSMTAQGAPQLTINNSSDLYLAVGDLTIKDAGGQLKFNGSDLKSTSSGNNFTGTTKADGLGTDAPTITVNSNSSSAFAGNPSPQADIGIFGDITNTAGDIKVNNDNYNVLVQGNISGRNITLSAVNGSVTQTSSEGLINIGGDPVTRYQFSDAVAKKIQNYLYQKGSNVTYTFNSYEEYKNWLINTVGIDAAELNYTVDESAGIVAGDNVYISGLNVNIGGLVQSGYGNYSTELSAADASKVAALDAGWAANQRPLSDNEVMSNEAYCINGGGKVWNSTTKVWDYEVKVYYNPYTKQLLTDNITPNGGKIYITGKISSTGNGRLMAMDGAADISINTAQIDRAVKVNTITNNDISGLISITDKNTNLVTEYMNGQQRSYAVGTATVNLPAWTAGADTYTYTPKNGLQYQWTGGVSGETTKKYSYSEKFLFWGLLDYGNTGEFVAGLNRDGKTYTYTTSSGSGQSLATGSVITTGNLSNQFKISSNYYNTGTEQYSEVTADKRYDGTAGKIFGYGTTYYYWTGKQGTANSSTSSLKADYGIDIGFLGNGQGSGNINVTSNQDMVLAGNISNAAVIDNSGDSNYKGLGNVTLTSNHGSVTSLGNAKINSDDVVVRADTGIQVNHAAIGSKATVDAATNDGNINFLSDRGDLNIVRMVTGGSRAINAETGNIYLQAEGSIFDTAGGSYAIKGQRIDLLSRTGAIGTKGQSLRVLGGSELFSGDSMTSSVNATAQGDIVLTQTSGNMRLGTIESANGDAVLTVADGSFVDAYNEDSVGLSDSAAKVDRWLENGLISSADADDSSSQAAEDAKAERLAGLDSRAEALAGGEAGKIQAYKDAAQAYADDGDLQTAKAVYIEAMQKADGISDATEKNAAITDAYTAYQQAQENYFANTGYSSDEQNLVASYAEVSSSGNYGWSKNQLLYAIQESVINSKPGQVQTVAKANVTANNITLTAANGGIGVDAADRVINYADLGQLENLQLLASAKAGDLTWNAEANTVTFRQQRAINLQTRDQGEIHATGRDNVYLAGTKDTVFNISGIETQNDIKLMSDNGVHMIGTGLLQGKNLIIYGGNGSIGSEDKHIETKLSGTLDANSAKSVYLTQKDGVLTIQAVSAGEEVVITAADGMQMSTEEGKDMGYISAGTQISLASEKGDIGIADNGVRILNNGAVINADGKNINLAGKESGSLVLGNINAEGAFTLNSAGNVSLGRAQVENSEGQVVIPAVMGQVTAQDSGVINAVNIALDHGGITVNDTEGQLLLQATGNITQNAAADGIRVKSLTAVTGGGQSLLSQNNEISNFSAQSIGQDNSINGGVEFVSNAAAGLTVQLNNLQVKEGNVSISNIAAGGAMVIKGGINAAVGNIEFSGKGDLSTEGVLQAAEDIKMTASGSIINHDNVTAGAMLDMQAGKDITNNSTVEAGEALTMTAEGSIANKDTINAGGVVMLQAQTDISNSAAVTSGTGFGISMTAVTGGIANKGSVISGADVALKAQQDIFNEDDIRADAKILMEAAERDIVNQGSLTAGAEDVAIDLLAGRGDILNTNSSAAITAVGTVQMQAQAGNIGNAATIASGTGADVLLTADGNIVNSGAIGSGRLVSFAAGSNISNTAAITAVDSITMTAGNDINNSDMLTAGSSVILTAGNDIGNTAAITAAEAITMEAASDITSDGTLTAVKDVQLIADGGNINIDDGGTVTSKQGSINLVTKNNGAAGQGAITVNAALDAKNAINVLADHGDVFIGADATAQDGILTVNVAEGNIKSNHFDGGENPGGSDVKLTSVNGSVDIYTGKGDVDLHEVYAKDKASVGTENGHLRLCKIDGNIVVLIIKDMDNNMDVKEIIAGNQIVISGNKISLDDIKQRDDADGMLIISPGGADADEPIESFNIKNINTGNGVRFDKLWVKNADLHVDSGRFYIDKLAVVDVAHFSNRDMRTAVYGTPALRDGSDSIYWYDHAANDPKHDLLGWHNDNYLGNWMHLYFTDKYRTQISNGVLLSLKDHYYAHNQRFTGEDHLRFLKKEMPLDVHEKNNNPRISLYQRFALYELPEAEQQEGAEASIVVAEDV